MQSSTTEALFTPAAVAPSSTEIDHSALPPSRNGNAPILKDVSTETFVDELNRTGLATNQAEHRTSTSQHITTPHTYEYVRLTSDSVGKLSA